MRILGRKLGISVRTAGSSLKIIGVATDCSLTVTSDVVEIASGSQQAKAYDVGRYGYTIQVECLYDVTGGGMIETLLESQLDGLALGWSMADESGYVTYGGTAYVTGYTVKGGVNGYATASVNLQGTGELSVN